MLSQISSLAFLSTLASLFARHATAFPQATVPTNISASSSSTACNNFPELCSRTYNNVTHLGAHDSPFVMDASTDDSSSGNQFYNSTVQLESGVRLLSAQVHKADNGSWDLCHTNCALLDAGPLSLWLGDIKTWLDSNPREVVTILLVNSDNAQASDLGGEFESSGVTKYTYAPTAGSSSWPTLGSLISSNKRLVTFVASLPSTSATYPYLLNEFDHVFENPYTYTDPSTFSCDAQRPSSDTTTLLSQGMMPLQNHFLDVAAPFGITLPDVSNAGRTNAPASSVNGSEVGSLAQSASNCTTIWGKAPTFVLVDWFNVGPAIETIDSLNGLDSVNAVGRTTVSTADQAVANASPMTLPATRLVVGLATAVVALTSFL
ncbi:MAG: hypothetical protein M1828_000882 [Chrysothrix sp. TS-e1954]|nr:MAG: hypothetical protein M1828_000882 [Chrysothrix sp. TS-e1954]